MFRLFALFLTLFICVISVVVVYFNSNSYVVDFIIIKLTYIPVGILLFLAMIFGILISLFFLLGLIFSMRKKYKKLKKDYELINKEVQNLRRIPIQE